MPPTTRSRGVPPPARVYNSTTTPQQAQFPPRRKVVRTYGKQNRRTPARNLRQQTLTQIDFVSSFDEEKDPIVLSSDDEDLSGREEADQENQVDEEEDDEDKENRPVQELQAETDDQETEVEAEDEENEQPVSSGRKRRSASKKAATDNDRAKRRRTLGDNSAKKLKKEGRSSRRKTTGDAPSSGSGAGSRSSYHTQTLTQFLGRGSDPGQYIRDSEDEDDGFQDWLQDPPTPTPKRNLKPSRSPLKTLFERERTESRQSSVVPQTPSRPPRDEIPSSSQASTPMSTVLNHQGNPMLQNPSSSKIYSSPSARPVATPSKDSTTTSSPLSTIRSTMLNRYGPPNIMDPSPSHRVSSPLVTTPLRLKLTGKPKIKSANATPKLEIQDTFATESWGSNVTPTPQRQKLMTTPQRATTPTRESSSLDEEDVDTPTKPRQRQISADLGDGKTTKTPSPRKMKRVSPRNAKKVLLEIPDSDEEEEGFDSDDDGGFVAGPETQFVMNEIASSEEEAEEAAKENTASASTPVPTPVARVLRALKSSSAISKPQRQSKSSPSVPSSQPTSPGLPSSPPKTKPVEDTRKRLRQPLYHPTNIPVQTQPLESQRVPLATLQALPPASFRSDILLPVSSDDLSLIIGGFQIEVKSPFKIPIQVVRFWLFDGEWLRYMACAEAGEREKGSWRYQLSQVYELNNPLEGSDMREEGWLEGDIGRYIYIPPAVVGQLLWNLRHALFTDGDPEETEDHHEIPQEEQASSPLSGGQTKIRTPTPTPNLSVSQQVEAQLQSDIAHSTQFPTSDDILVPSTPEDEETAAPSTSKTTNRRSPSIKPPPSHLTNPPTSYRASRPPLTRPSQATTASQASTPEKQSHSAFYSRPSHHSSSSIVFESIGDSSPIRMPQSVPLGSSQLLTKSQMLPDSLVRDDARVPPEIWDSDEDADATL